MRRAIPILLTVFCTLVFSQAGFAGWVKQRVSSFAWFQGVYFLNENRGWITGSRGTILTTADGGATWQKIKSGIDDNIKDVYFFDEQNGWLLCERDRYQLGSNAPSYLMRTSDGGAHWDNVELGGPGSP